MELTTISLYMASVVLITYILLKYVFKATGETERFLISVISGILLGAVWYIFINAPLDQLIFSYLGAVGFYHIIIKRVMAYFEDKYNNGKGVI